MTVPTTDHRSAQTPVRAQGDRPACVGFAVAAAHEWMSDGAMLSVEDVLWAGHQVGGNPLEETTSVQFALLGLNRYGHATEAAWPYGSPAWPADRPVAAAKSARPLPAWQRLPSLTFSAVTSQLARGVAVLLTLRVVPGIWYQRGGIIDTEPGRKAPGNHAVVAVGAIDGNDPVTRRAIIKNSWGTGWGQSGYGLISQRYVDAYGVCGHVLEFAA
jgi:hypothetical protein